MDGQTGRQIRKWVGRRVGRWMDRQMELGEWAGRLMDWRIVDAYYSVIHKFLTDLLQCKNWHEGQEVWSSYPATHNVSIQRWIDQTTDCTLAEVASVVPSPLHDMLWTTSLWGDRPTVKQSKPHEISKYTTSQRSKSIAENRGSYGKDSWCTPASRVVYSIWQFSGYLPICACACCTCL